MRTIIYIDGFNFYYGAVKGTPYKWLDLKSLFQQVLKAHNQIVQIKYFTARVFGTPNNPGTARRQDAYLRALKSYIPEIEIYYGHFMSHEIDAPLAGPGLANPRFARIIKTEEKGSDVNLAVHVLNDAWLDEYDCAVVVSNDSDLAESMRLVKAYHNKTIGLITPSTDKQIRPSRQLMKHADFKRRLRKGALVNSQLPNQIPGTNIHRPASW